METAKAVGIIIGGTNTSVGIVAPDGTIEAQTRFATRPRDGFAAGLERIIGAIHDLCAKVNLDTKDIRGIGIGCTGPVDPKTGIILTDFTLPTWGACNITLKLQEALKAPVLLENNADAAVVGEAFVGAGQPCHHVVLLTFGTGVGGSVLVNGEIYRGSQGEHPEIGHIPVRRNGPRCYCGIRGCLEMVASGTAITAAGRRIGLNGAPEVFAQAAAGNPKAKKIIDRAVECTALGIWTILHTFLPEKIILGGGIMDEHYHLFEPAVRAVMTKATMIPEGRVSLAKARLGNDAGIVGAAVLAFQRTQDH